MKIILKILLLFLCPLLIYSCQGRMDNSYSYTLLLDRTSSIINQETFTYDSIAFVQYGNDSIIMEKCSNKKCFHFTFVSLNGDFVERRYRFNDIGEFFGIDSILTFGKKNTNFIYKSAYDFVPIVQSYAYADCQYSIKNVGSEYITTKQSTIDTTYKEIFFYDKDYKIYKYINTWQDNECVYVKKD